MSRFTGRLEFRDLGSGTWLLHTDDGETLQLAGAVPEKLGGQRVEVRGKRVSLHGFAMTGGGGVDVDSVKALD